MKTNLIFSKALFSSGGPSGPSISIFLEDRICFFVNEGAKTSNNNDFLKKQTKTRSYTADAVWYRQPSGKPTNTVMLNSN